MEPIQVNDNFHECGFIMEFEQAQEPFVAGFVVLGCDGVRNHVERYENAQMAVIGNYGQTAVIGLGADSWERVGKIFQNPMFYGVTSIETSAPSMILPFQKHPKHGILRQ